MDHNPEFIDIKEFDYEFGEHLIAQRPMPRGESNILTCEPHSDKFDIIKAKNIVDLFHKGDCLVVNNTKVIPARLFGEKSSGGKFEILLVCPAPGREGVCWEAWVKPGKYFKQNTFQVVGGIQVEVVDILADGSRILDFKCTYAEFQELLSVQGKVPLPPYILRDADEADTEAYQTIFAKHEGAVASPTASLHFSEEMIEVLKSKGVFIAEVTLHVGPGTFKPVEVENALDHPMHGEVFDVSQASADIINEAKKQGGRIITLGTTSTRVIETVADETGFVTPQSGTTHKYITPGYRFKLVDGMVTNFHFPRTTLLLLVSALLGKEEIKKAYAYAVQKEMRLFSYGDGMIILAAKKD
jgi:S-adenosylmethionine:tRNA ribosyltransferase-isomerase